MDCRLGDTVASRVISVFDDGVRRLGDTVYFAIHRPGDAGDVGRCVANQFANRVVFVVARRLGGNVARIADARNGVVDVIELVGTRNIVVLQLIHLVARTRRLPVAMVGEDVAIGVIAGILLVIGAGRKGTPGSRRPLPGIHMRQPVELVVLVGIQERRIQLLDIDPHAADVAIVERLVISAERRADAIVRTGDIADGFVVAIEVIQ